MAERADSSLLAQGWIGDTPVSYSGLTALRREQCDMVAESQNSLTRKVIQSNAMASEQVSTQPKHMSAARDTRATTEELLEAVFSAWSDPPSHRSGGPISKHLKVLKRKI
jgi:hypothetical protein